MHRTAANCGRFRPIVAGLPFRVPYTSTPCRQASRDAPASALQQASEQGWLAPLAGPVGRRSLRVVRRGPMRWCCGPLSTGTTVLLVMQPMARMAEDHQVRDQLRAEALIGAMVHLKAVGMRHVQRT